MIVHVKIASNADCSKMEIVWKIWGLFRCRKCVSWGQVKISRIRTYDSCPTHKKASYLFEQAARPSLIFEEIVLMNVECHIWWLVLSIKMLISVILTWLAYQLFAWVGNFNLTHSKLAILGQSSVPLPLWVHDDSPLDIPITWSRTHELKSG